MSTANSLIILSYMIHYTMGGFEEKVEILLNKRNIRECGVHAEGSGLLPQLGLSLGLLILLGFIGILLLLICLGIMKAILGILCLPGVGIFGMNVLIDLPRPMKRYQEKELAGMEVVYDVAGWPIHPQTGKRVRSLSKNTEFCLNLVFFLTYPFVMLISLCSICCYKSYDEEGFDNNVYNNINTVVFSNCPRKQVNDCKDKAMACKSTCLPKDVYQDEDSTEDADTKYVLQQMNDSQGALHH